MLTKTEKVVCKTECQRAYARVFFGGSTNAGMDWNGMDYWNGQKNRIPQGSTGLIGHVLSARI